MKFHFPLTKEFRKNARERFLAVFDARYPVAGMAPDAIRPGLMGHIFRIAAASLVAAFVVLGGAAIYADAANVSATNPLYPLKRAQESVRLTIAPPAEKATLQATFAARRVEELQTVETQSPSSGLVAKLSRDADDAVNASVSDAASANLGDGALTNLCGGLLGTVASSSAVIEDDSEKGLVRLDQFTDKCLAMDDDSRGAAAAPPAASSTVAPAAIPAAAPMIMSARVHPDNGIKSSLQMKIQHYLEKHDEHGGEGRSEGH